MLEIKSTDSVSITQVANTQGYDAHALRACAYFAENMPDIIEKRKEVAKQGQTYKVVYSDGSVDYFNESNPILITALQELKEK